jgi:hypothetical protein
MGKLSKEEKVKSFQNEIDCIKDGRVRNALVNMIGELIPDYFWEVAAASTGKYHPSYAQGEGGLYRHTLAAVRIAIGMFPLTNYSDAEKDDIIVALIMHDSFKHGVNHSKYTCADHPVIAANQFKAYCALWLDDQNWAEEFSKSVSSLILTHMAQWNTDWKNKKEIMPKPSKSMQKFVHMCDYLASRKYLEFNFAEVVKRD